MKHLPSRLRRLDAALADLPLDDPMLLSELDGFLTGILLSPEPISPGEWMTVVWGLDTGGVAPFEDPLDVQWFADAVAARLAEIGRDVARGRPQPIFDVDERNGDVIWEPWVDGFDAAMALRPDAWARVDEPAAVAAISQMSQLIAAARDDGTFDAVELDALQDRAPAEVIAILLSLHACRARPEAEPVGRAKVGRNDPCPCGSGRKSKRCCA